MLGRSLVPYALALPLFALTASCGSSESDGADGAPAPVAANGGAATLSGGVLTFDSGEFEIPAGESFFCFWTPFTTPTELSVVKADAKQSVGGHHVTAYYADVVRKPQMRQCDSTDMVDWHFAIAAGGEGAATTEFAALPDGLAIKMQSQKQLLIQLHYINTTGAPQKVRDSMTITTTDPANVKAYAADFVIMDDQWKLPPHMETTAVSTCTVTEDINLVMMLGHMHQAGKHYRLELMEPGETTFKTFEASDYDWKPAYTSHPPSWRRSMDQALSLKKGTKFRQTCQWNNDSSDTLGFPTEMCISFGYRYPATERLFCERDN